VYVSGDSTFIYEIDRIPRAHQEVAMYASMTHRELTIIVDIPNEDALFEALYATWVGARTYPTVTPVVTMHDFPGMLARVGLGPN
jgi:hypothetical protein